MTDLNAAEKRALAARTNAFLAMAKALNSAMGHSIALTQITPADRDRATIIVPLAPAGMMALIEGMQHTVKQLEISVGVIVDMLLEEDHVCSVPDPQATADEKAPPLLSPSILTKENYLNRCAAAAEKTTATITRGILSQGPAPDPHRLIRPS